MRCAPFFVLVLAASLNAQPQEPVLPPGGDMSPAEIQKLFDGYVIGQAKQVLQLSDQQFAQFVPRLITLQETRRRAQQERVRLINELQRLTRQMNARGAAGPGPADEAALKDRLSALQELESRSAAEMRKAYNGVDEVLSIPQQARFRVFEEGIERKKLDLLLRARQQNRSNPNRQPPKGPPPVQ